MSLTGARQALATQPENHMAAKKATKKAAAKKAAAKQAPAKKAAAKKPAGKPAAKKAAKKAASRKPAGKRKGGTTSVPGISRIDQESTRTHGYFVRVGYHRTAEGSWRPKDRAFFGDAGHGGKEKALKAAMKWLKDAQKA